MTGRARVIRYGTRLCPAHETLYIQQAVCRLADLFPYPHSGCESNRWREWAGLRLLPRTLKLRTSLGRQGRWHGAGWWLRDVALNCRRPDGQTSPGSCLFLLNWDGGLLSFLEGPPLPRTPKHKSHGCSGIIYSNIEAKAEEALFLNCVCISLVPSA